MKNKNQLKKLIRNFHLNDIKDEKLKSHYIKASIGVRKAHLDCVRDAKEKGYKKILIFEDDIIVDKNSNKLFPKIINEIGDDWDLLYLGGDYRENNITFQLSSYALDSKVFDYLLGNREESGLEDDYFFIEFVQKKFETYRATPMIMWQSKVDTDIQVLKENMV